MGLPRPPGRARRARARDGLGAPGRGRRGGARGATRRGGDRHRVRQVAGLRGAGAQRDPRGPRPAGRAGRDGALPRPDEGPRAGSARRRAGARSRRAGDHARRGLLARAARLGTRPRGVPADQPRHAAPLAPARARALGRLSQPAALRGGRRVPSLPRRFRGTRRPGPAAAATDLRRVRRQPHVRPRLGHRRRARGGGGPADGARGGGRHRRRLPARRGGARALGAALEQLGRGGWRSGAPGGLLRGSRPAGRPRGGGRGHARLRPLAAGGRAGRGDDRRPARRRRPVAAGEGRRLPRGLPARGATGARGGPAGRSADRVGRHERARARDRRQRARRRAAGGLPGHPCRAVAAGGPGRPGRRGRGRRHGGARRPAGHLSRHPSRRALRPTGRGHGLRPRQPPRPLPTPVCRGPGGPADPRRPDALRPRGRAHGDRAR